MRRYLTESRAMVALVAVVAVVCYVAYSALEGGPGFPLDDGWIHQTYARNLASDGSWAFVPGLPSAGSTSPLWTLLLSPGYLLPVSPLGWTFFLGALCLVWLGWVSVALWPALWPGVRGGWMAGVAVTLSWHLIWAAASGMETLLFSALALTLLLLFVRDRRLDDRRHLLAAGLGSGVLVVVRPEGLLLVVLLAAALAWQQAWANLLRLLLLALLPLLPYFALNEALSGQWWPNTLYAKQAEYTVLLQQPLWERLLRLFYVSAGGPGSGWRGISAARLLLMPGLFGAIWLTLRDERLCRLLPLLWAGGHLFAYAWRLPVTYQHGRYLLAVVPVGIIYGLRGWIWLLDQLPRKARLLRQSATLSYLVLLLFFFLLGAQAYANDVAFIEGEMVTTARWLRENTPRDTLVAAHDIGAIGYFAQRPLLDLAGLISPEIVPLLGNERAVARYVLESEADYLVTAPGWPYRLVTTAPQVELLFRTDYAWTRDQGTNNMAVYRLPPSR